MQAWKTIDAVETAECWALALQSETPSILALTRQNLTPVRTEAAEENLCARGAYRLKSAENNRKVVIIATGVNLVAGLG